MQKKIKRFVSAYYTPIIIILPFAFVAGVAAVYGLWPVFITIIAAPLIGGLIALAVPPLLNTLNLVKSYFKNREKKAATKEEQAYIQKRALLQSKVYDKPTVEPKAQPKNYNPSEKPNSHKQGVLVPGVLAKVAEYLTLSEIKSLKQVDKHMQTNLTPLKFTPQHKVEAEIRKTYSHELLDICGVAVFASLPVLDLATCQNYQDSNYIDYVTVEDLKGNNAMRGIDAHGRPFICLSLSSTKLGKEPQVATIFQRYIDDKNGIWQTAGWAGQMLLPNPATEGRDKLYQTLNAILKNTHNTIFLSKPAISKNTP